MANDPTVPHPTPRGRQADERIIGAIQNLVDQMAVCGLKAPVGIVLAPGELRRFEASVAVLGSSRHHAAVEQYRWFYRL